jgi:hypothetical protein
MGPYYGRGLDAACEGRTQAGLRSATSNHGKHFRLEADQPAAEQSGQTIGGILTLSAVGRELMPVVGAVFDEHYMQACLTHFRETARLIVTEVGRSESP